MIALPKNQKEHRKQLYKSDDASRAASAMHKSRKRTPVKTAAASTVEPEKKETTHHRCDRCELKFPTEELRPVPRYQSKPGIPEPLRVTFKGNAGTNHAATLLCVPCCVSVIERHRFHPDQEQNATPWGEDSEP